MSVAETVHIIGASGRSGQALSDVLRAAGRTIVPVVRDARRWRGPETPRLTDLTGPEAALRDALSHATRIVSCAHARHIPAILAAAPASARFVFLGSTRKFTRWPDEHARGVLAGETAWLASGRAGVLLHPTMIYGASGENNVRRLAALARYLPVVALPGRGRALVRPIHQDDVTRCVLAALDRLWEGPEICVIAGADSVSYAAFLAAVCRSAGVSARPVVAVPAWPLMALAWLTRLAPALPRVDPDEIRRLNEDKSFDIGPMRAVLGVEPVGLAEGLARTFGTLETPTRAG